MTSGGSRVWKRQVELAESETGTETGAETGTGMDNQRGEAAAMLC